MAEPQFFTPAPQLSVADIAELTGATPRDGAALDRRIAGIAALDQAGPRDLAFMDNPKYLDQLPGTRAGICLVGERFAAKAPADVCVLVSREPYRAFVEVARNLYSHSL